MCKYKYNTHRKTGHFLKRHLNKKSYSDVKLRWIAKCSVTVRTFPPSAKRPQIGVAHLVERRHEVLVVLEHRPDQLRAVSVYLEDRLHKLRRHLATGPDTFFFLQFNSDSDKCNFTRVPSPVRNRYGNSIRIPMTAIPPGSIYVHTASCAKSCSLQSYIDLQRINVNNYVNHIKLCDR